MRDTALVSKDWNVGMTSNESESKPKVPEERSRPLWREPAIVVLMLVVGIFVAQMAAFRWYQWKGERFCEALEVGLPQVGLLQRAQKAHMERWPESSALPEGRGEMSFVTDRAPWYRHVCRVRLIDERVASVVLEPGG